MSARDYARIMWWKKKTLGLMLVNRHHQNFFLHAETLIGMVDKPGTFKIVKRRDRSPEESRPVHPGDILGKVTEGADTVDLILCFGEVERRVKIDRETGEVANVLDRQTYVLPVDEFDVLYKGLKLMVEQAEPYNGLWRSSRSEVPAFYFVDADENVE